MPGLFVEQPLALPGFADYIISVLGSTQDIRSNITLCLQKFTWALPSETPSGKGLYPLSCPNMDTKQACCAGCKRRPFTAEAPTLGKIQPFSKIAVTFEQVMKFGCPSRFQISLKMVT